LWIVVVGAAVWFSTAKELDELQDDTLQASAELLSGLVQVAPESVQSGVLSAGLPMSSERFAWQLLNVDGRVLLRSTKAPSEAWRVNPVPGFVEVPGWRVFASRLGDGRVLNVAQTRDERHEARSEVLSGALLSALLAGVLGYFWLLWRVGGELEPLRDLSRKLDNWNLEPSSVDELLGPPTRRELEPVHQAITTLAQRLRVRMDNERAFAAHAAHALRTPLAGIDAQLAVALREAPENLHERLRRVRDAAHRLQTVVAALLGLFRSGSGVALQQATIDVAALVERMPLPDLQVHVTPGLHCVADPDLLAAALLNLFDNALRHGAHYVWVTGVDGNGVSLHDDGPGIDPQARKRLQQALDAERYEEISGLGLMLADRVARTHGGRLLLRDQRSGCHLELWLGGEVGKAI